MFFVIVYFIMILVENFGHLKRGQFSTKEVSVKARLAQSVEHETLNLRVVGSSPTLGVYVFCYCLFYNDFS